MLTLILCAIVVLVLVAMFVFPAYTPAISDKGKSSSSKSIAVLEKVRLGGCKQWILERSEDINNPVILFLHGGPGAAQLTLNRRNTKRLEQYFVVVNWDQRGAGKSYAAIKDVSRMNIEQFVEDTKQLTLYLLKKFNKQRIVLVGHSWGSVIGALAVSKYPELFYCYVGIGQVVNMVDGETASYEWTLQQAKQRNDKRAINALEKTGPPPYTGNWQAKTNTERRYLAKFGGEVYGSKTGAFWFIISGLMFSAEYSIIDKINFFSGALNSQKLLWPQLMKINFFKTIPEIKIPVFFIEGKYDYEAPAEVASRYFATVKAPFKELIWFEKSAHMPNFEQTDLFNQILLEKVLPMVGNNVLSKPFINNSLSQASSLTAQDLATLKKVLQVLTL